MLCSTGKPPNIHVLNRLYAWRRVWSAQWKLMQRDTDNVKLCGEVAKGWAQSPLGYRVLLKQFSWKCLEGRVIQQGGISEFSRTTLQQSRFPTY
jgi:hypothetical protein